MYSTRLTCLIIVVCKPVVKGSGKNFYQGREMKKILAVILWEVYVGMMIWLYSIDNPVYIIPTMFVGIFSFVGVLEISQSLWKE